MDKTAGERETKVVPQGALVPFQYFNDDCPHMGTAP